MNEIIRQIHQMSCARVYYYSRYIFGTDYTEVEFGKKTMSIGKVCEQFPNVPARSIVVAACCGPPTNSGTRMVTLSELMQDWYMACIAYQYLDVLRKFETCLDCKVGVTLA